MILELPGCTHESLGSYLKGFAVLRLVTQADPEARGCWGQTCFVLDSSFDRESLVEFFLRRYRPTPVLAPWNGGSGFYDKDRKIGIEAILGTKDNRFATYRADLEGAKRIVTEAGATGEYGERRTAILKRCRNELSDDCVDWLDAAIAISSEESRAFAPILGTGGNEGRLDYTNNFMERLSELLITPDQKLPVRELLLNSLFGDYSGGLQNIAAGQYEPGRAGGFNQGEKIEAACAVNPWSAVLTLEGAGGWVGGVYRKQGVSYRSFLCSPFTVRPSAVGYGSASGKDEENARAEIWTPLWIKPARFAEVKALWREGRASVDGRPAANGLDFAQATASLGVDRGIDSFVRFSLLKRRGDSYIALRTGQFAVKHRSAADLVRDLGPLLEAAGRAAKGATGEVPNSWPPLRRAAEEAMFQALLHARDVLLVDVAASFGAMHKWLLERRRQVYWPGRLSEQWVKRLWHVTPEVRIAAALAAMWSDKEEAGRFLENLSPQSPRFSWTGRDLSSRMIATLRRRTLDGAQSDRSPFASKLFANKSDVIAFLERRRNEELIENLTFAFVRAKLPHWEEVRTSASEAGGKPWLRWATYSVLKQLFAWQTHPVPSAPTDEPRFRPDLAVTGLLQGGQVERAMKIALNRLRIEGVRTVVSRGWDTEDGNRLGAALLIPVRDVKSLRQAVTREEEENKVFEER